MIIDGDALMMSLADWWYSSFGQEETAESEAIRKVMHQVEESLKQYELPSQSESEECDTCKHGYFGDSSCNNCRVRYPSHYEREENG